MPFILEYQGTTTYEVLSTIIAMLRARLALCLTLMPHEMDGGGASACLGANDRDSRCRQSGTSTSHDIRSSALVPVSAHGLECEEVTEQTIHSPQRGVKCEMEMDLRFTVFDSGAPPTPPPCSMFNVPGPAGPRIDTMPSLGPRPAQFANGPQVSFPPDVGASRRAGSLRLRPAMKPKYLYHEMMRRVIFSTPHVSCLCGSGGAARERWGKARAE
ncbi:hypothetical protein LX36DRAFT_344017 [Colletotrichum falcatum]|nr:hypothetical protein LX36DRAFT_344017 [Colletotrichum falcatum]